MRVHVGEGGIELAARITDKQIERERGQERERNRNKYKNIRESGIELPGAISAPSSTFPSTAAVEIENG
jgi:hypothetical protein